jgi:hypothetical protein
MPTWTWGLSWTWALWNALGFLGFAVWASFAEWAVHRFVMHRRLLLSFPFELHAVGHHGMFGGDETYHAQDQHMKEHVTFVLRDYILLMLANLPLWTAAEWLSGRPVLAGGFLATLAYLQAFNSLHWRWHVPSDTWFQRTRVFLWMKDRHRIHHHDMTRNFNLVLPLGDLVLGTFVNARPDPGRRAAERARSSSE